MLFRSHRDFNPSNVYVARTAAGTHLKVLDFGVAKIVGERGAVPRRAATIGNIRVFSPAYGAPEQWTESLGPVGTRADVYAFALLFVEVLADRAPIEGDHLGEIADQVLDRARRPTPRALGVPVDDEVEAVFAAALAVDQIGRAHV